MRFCKAKMVGENGKQSIIPEESGTWIIDKFTGDYIGDMTQEELTKYNSLKTEEEYQEWTSGA